MIDKNDITFTEIHNRSDRDNFTLYGQLNISSDVLISRYAFTREVSMEMVVSEAKKKVTDEIFRKCYGDVREKLNRLIHESFSTYPSREAIRTIALDILNSMDPFYVYKRQ